MRFTRWAAMLMLVWGMSGCRKSGPPYPVTQALGTFQIEPGYRIEPFAAEPDVLSPAAMEWDEDGRIYVVEDRAYPLNTEGKIGQVVMLEDTNGDGIPDRSTVFADHLVMPTGVMRWKKGILVTDAPDVIYFEDTNGDGKADFRRVVLTGFAVTNPQHTVNGPVYGLDNWIYLAHENAATAIIYKDKFGDRGTDISMPEHPETPPLKEHARNVRFRPDTGQLEALAGSSQFGHTFDDWGHHFTINNSNHAREEVIAARYLQRNPDLPLAAAMQNISDHGAAAKVFPITLHPRFELLTDVGQFTSACSITWYRGALFEAEPAHNLVHRDLVSGQGSTFTARRDRPNAEFLASTDAWFRPVGFYVGPDGALYLLDFYRLMIEHPEWMSTQAQKSPDLTKGIDRGRIYRIVPDGGLDRVKNLHLGSASNQELVKELANPNIWWRRTAQRLLMDRKAVDAAPDLERLAQGPSAVGRLHALWTLEGLGRLETPLIEKALADPEAGVRENAIILAEAHLAAQPALAGKLLAMTDDPDAKVRLQLLATLGYLHTPAAAAARGKLLARDLEDKWFQVAALSAGSDEAARTFAGLAGGQASPGRESLLHSICAVIGTRQKPAEVQGVLQKVASVQSADAQWWRTASLEGLGLGMRVHHGGVTPAGQETLLKLTTGTDVPVRRAALRLLQITGLPKGAAAQTALAHAAAAAADPQADAEVRADALTLLALADPRPQAALLEKLIDPHQPEQVETAAVRAYGRISGTQPAVFLLKNWREMTPAVRSAAADAMFLEKDREQILVKAMQDGAVQPWTLDFRHRHRLIMADDPEIRGAARPLLEQSPAEREAVVSRYQSAADQRGDSAHGRQVFRSVCAKCHRLEGYGAEVGPNLLTVHNQPKQSLLRDILIPSESIAQGYEAYVIETAGGGTIDGVIGQQTPTTITLKHEDGKEDVIQRKDIKTMYITNLSAMPGDLEKQVSVAQMTDLLEYLKMVQ
ncbi:MAG TPA: PVC-type heme-binding CxxCH protein [Bryobacteraceae bacterium]|nr:PVC-type heme-binding CxxCH protein [Bryobacteraceae bacterium]